MKPLLYARTYIGASTDTLLGTLADATSCIVTEQRNGEYELEMEYLPTGVLANELKTGAVILAIPSYGATAQPFRIYQVDKSLTGTIQVNAHHISYDLNKVYLKYFNDTTGITATLAAIKTNLIQQSGDTTDWTFTNDGITNTTSTFQHPEPSTVRAALGGTEGSVLDVFGGEYEWNGFNVIIHRNRGEDRGVYVRYAGNLLEFNREEDFENAYTHVMVYWFDEETGNKTTSLSYAVSDVIAADFTQSRTAVINVTDQFETQPNRATLNPIAQDYAAKMTSKPTIGLEVKFVDLNSTTEGGAEAPVKLCDTIHVIDPVRDVSISAKVVETRWNVLLDRYEDVTIGTKGKNIADTISGLQGNSSSSSGGGGGGGSTETDYRNLSNKPQINGVELDGNKSLSTLGIASASDLAATTATANAAVKDVTVNGSSVVNANKVAAVVVPTKTSDLTNDSNFITLADVPAAPVTSVNGQTGAVNLSIPDSTSDLTNDSGFITSAGAPVQSVNGQTGAVVLPIPDSTSDLTNDSGYITANDVPAQTAKIWTAKTTTAAGTAAKVVTLDVTDGFPGWGSDVVIALTFTNGNTAANPTLSYNGTAIAMAGYTGTSITTPSTSAEANKVGKGETVLLYPSGQYLVHGATEAQIGDIITNKAPLASPALTGTPTAPTAAAGTSTTQLATTAFVQNAVSQAGGGYNQNLWTGKVTTAAGTAAKTVTLDDPTSFPGWGNNTIVALTFTNGNSAANPTLSYAGLAIPMAGYDGSSITTPSTTAAANMIGAGETVLLYPSGQYYVHGGKGSGGSSGVQSVTPVYSSGTKIASFATSGGTVDLYLPVWNGSVTP